MKKRLIQIKNAIKYFFVLAPNKEKIERLYKGGYISLRTYSKAMKYRRIMGE
jgi:hypothetical protein